MFLFQPHNMEGWDLNPEGFQIHGIHCQGYCLYCLIWSVLSNSECCGKFRKDP